MKWMKGFKKCCRAIPVLLCIGLIAGPVYAGEGPDDTWLDDQTQPSTPGKEATAKSNKSANSNSSEGRLPNNIVLTDKPLPEFKGGGDYHIGAHDLLSIKVFQAPELSTETRVDFLGSVQMPLIGAIKVKDLTPTQASWLIAKKLGEKYLQHPQVQVFVKEYTSQRVIVSGFVVKPGVYTLEGYTSLIEVLAKAGGLKELANAGKVAVFRPEGQGKIIGYSVNVNNVQAGLASDPVILAGDRIIVAPASGKSWVEYVMHLLGGFGRLFGI